MQVFDFDRCSGRLSSLQDTLVRGGKSDSTGVDFSHNSRYLYVVTGKYLYQYDQLGSSGFRGGREVGRFDGYRVPLFTAFFQMMLAPDDKIYMTSPAISRYLHVIHHPDLAGNNCFFEQRSLKLFHPHGFSVPNFPYFRLFDAQDAPCDTLGINLLPPPEGSLVKPMPCAAQPRLYPNPALYGT